MIKKIDAGFVENDSSISGLIRVHVSSIVYEVIRTISIFLQKKIKSTKTRHKQKSINETKTSKQKTTKAIIFCAQKFLRGRKLVILRFCAFKFFL